MITLSWNNPVLIFALLKNYGQLISVIYAWVILAFKIHSWGSIGLILWFTPLFSLLRLVFTSFSLIFRFELFKLKCANKRMIFDVLMIIKASEGGLKCLNTTKPCQERCAKKKRQNAVERGSRAWGTKHHHWSWSLPGHHGPWSLPRLW